ncbi:MAG: methylated-DNA--[protein]-cysteine S-methyltransferase [Bacilli bacterium]|jgi:methylated-DNA-[protein]-cysteine S-methyltransferase|nr:methylated-DNA--[protein]-cysteine S-methyltransferase [Bacilli bacterium]
MIQQSWVDSPWGRIQLLGQGEALIALRFSCQSGFIAKNKERIEEKETPVLKAAKEWLESYAKGAAPDQNFLCLSPEGTPFEQAVWKVLVTIPYGQTESYQEVGEQVCKALGKERMSAQAIGQAVSHNPISLIIPCHRVIGKNGALVGYDGGLDLKRALLAFEKRNLAVQQSVVT